MCLSTPSDSIGKNGGMNTLENGGNDSFDFLYNGEREKERGFRKVKGKEVFFFFF